MEAHSIKPPSSPGAAPAATGARKQRVLFVDDEAAILDALRGVLRPQRHVWDMVFALGGPAGLAEVEHSKFDVVVTDMRMRVVDGVALLTRVKELQPQAVRLVLSGQTDPQTAMKSVFAAHQFLAKPCDIDKLRNVVKRCCELNAMLAADDIKSLCGDVSVLPAAPTTYLSICRALSDPSSGVSDVARIVEREPALCAKVLQVVNSAFFGLPRAISSVSQAATYLGAMALRDLALAMEAMASAQRGKHPLPTSTYAAFQLNALGVGLLARRWFTSDRRKADDAFVTGVLRDMGHLVLAARAPSPVTPAAHATLSAYLLGLWGIPHPVLEAVAFHEEPERVEHAAIEVVDVVNLADALIGRHAPSPFQSPAIYDAERLERLGATPQALADFERSTAAALEDARKMLAA